MADTTATPTEPATTESGPSEFAQPRGVNDDAVWNKFFGADSKHFDEDAKPKGKGKAKKEEPWQEKDEKSAGKGSGKESKSSKDESEKPEKRSAALTKPSGKSTPEDEPSKPKGSKSSEKTDDSETDSDRPKHRDLFEQAKNATSKVEAQKLYKQAMKEAFGEVPDEFNDQKWKAAREKRDADRAAIKQAQDAVKAKEANLEARLNDAVKKLTPAINVMKALKEVQAGDYTKFGELVATALDKPVDEAMKLFVRGVKVSPEGRAARMAAEAAERRAAAAEARIAEMERKLSEKDEVRTRAERKQQTERARASYLESIETELDGHPVLRLPRGKERVMAFLIKTADKATKAPRYTKEEAADRVVAFERKRLQAARGVLEDPPGDEIPPERSNVRTIARSEVAEAGVQPSSPEASFSRIFDKHMRGGRR